MDEYIERKILEHGLDKNDLVESYNEYIKTLDDNGIVQSYSDWLVNFYLDTCPKDKAILLYLSIINREQTRVGVAKKKRTTDMILRYKFERMGIKINNIKKGNKYIVPCEVCGKDVTCRPSKIRMFCSYKCRGHAQKKHHTEDES